MHTALNTMKLTYAILKYKKKDSYTVSHKRILIYYGLCLEMNGNVFSIVFHHLCLLD